MNKKQRIIDLESKNRDLDFSTRSLHKTLKELEEKINYLEKYFKIEFLPYHKVIRYKPIKNCKECKQKIK